MQGPPDGIPVLGGINNKEKEIRNLQYCRIVFFITFLVSPKNGVAYKKIVYSKCLNFIMFTSLFTNLGGYTSGNRTVLVYRH